MTVKLRWFERELHVLCCMNRVEYMETDSVYQPFRSQIRFFILSFETLETTLTNTAASTIQHDRQFIVSNYNFATKFQIAWRINVQDLVVQVKPNIDSILFSESVSLHTYSVLIHKLKLINCVVSLNGRNRWLSRQLSPNIPQIIIFHQSHCSSPSPRIQPPCVNW